MSASAICFFFFCFDSGAFDGVLFFRIFHNKIYDIYDTLKNSLWALKKYLNGKMLKRMWIVHEH